MRILATLFIGLLGLSGLLATEMASELDQGGHLYTLNNGLYGDFFDDEAFEPDRPVLVLGLRTEDSISYSMVPGSGDGTFGSVASLVHDDFSNTTFVVWERRHSTFSSQVFVSRFLNNTWSEPVAVLANPFSQKLNLQTHISRSTMRDEANPENEQKRIILHVLWREPGTENDVITYVPMIFVDGEAALGRPAFSLEDLLGPFEGASPSPQLFTTWTQPNRQALAGAMIDDTTGQLTTFNIAELPDIIRHLADLIRQHIVELDVDDINTEEGRRQLAESVRARVIGAGLQIHPAVLSFIAEDVETLVMNSDDPQLIVGDKARARIIGAGLYALNLENPSILEEGWILEVDSGLGLHYLDLQTILRVEAPESWTVTEEDTLLVSQSGSTAALVSVGDTAVEYIIATTEGWSSLFTIPLSEDEDSNALLETVQRLLDRQ